MLQQFHNRIFPMGIHRYQPHDFAGVDLHIKIFQFSDALLRIGDTLHTEYFLPHAFFLLLLSVSCSFLPQISCLIPLF